MRKTRQWGVLVAAVAAVPLSTAAIADTLTWDGGGGDQFFGTADNWNPNQAPTSSDDVVFPSLPSAPPMTPLWEAADSVQGISIDNSGGFVWQLPRSGNNVAPRSVTIGSGGLTLTGGGSTIWGAVTTTASAAQTWDIGTGTTLQFFSGSGLAGTGKITKTGSGTINLFSSSSGFSGGWDITAGLVTNAGGSATNIYGTGATSVSGTGELNLNILGGGAVSGGAITLGHGGVLSGRTGTPHTGQGGLSSISNSGISVDTAANTSVIIKATHAGENLRITNALAGGLAVNSSTIRIQGPGEVHLLNGSNSSTAFLGTWKVEAGGTLRVESNLSLGVRNGTTPSAVELAGGAVRWAGTSSTSTAVTFTNPIVVTDSSTITLDKLFHATFGNTVVNSSGQIARVLGPLSIGAETLTVNVSDVVTGPTTAGSPVRIGGGSSHNHVVTLTGNATFNVVKPAGYDLTYSVTSINDGGNGHGYTKSGSGWMSVAGASTYSGPTSVLGGTLFLNNTGALGQTSLLHVASGATANLTSGAWTTKADLSGGGTISVGGAGITAQGSAVSPGDSAGILTVTGNLALALDGAAQSQLAIEIVGGGAVAGTDYDRLAVSGTLTGLSNTLLVVDLSDLAPGANLTGDVFTIVTSSSNFTGQSFAGVIFSAGATGDVSYNNGSITLSNVVVPEPTGLALLAVGTLAVQRRRRR